MKGIRRWTLFHRCVLVAQCSRRNASYIEWHLELENLNSSHFRSVFIELTRADAKRILKAKF